jgi:hypothetical protein
MKRWLLAAGIYNISWGLLVGLWPNLMFDWAGMERPNYPELWQCIAMIVGVYGVGYAAASLDPYRHWPIVLVGFLGKLFGPIGFVQAAVTERFSWWFGINNVTNDLIWLIPFALILKGAWTDRGPVGDLGAFLAGHRNALVVFLRHAGCTFCREALADVARQRKQIEADGTKIVLVHMGGSEEFFAQYGLADVERVHDPERALYKAFGLQRGSLWQLLGPSVWWRGFGAWRQHGVGFLEGDGFQMPGAFLVKGGRLVKEYRHATAGDRPDYCQLS